MTPLILTPEEGGQRLDAFLAGAVEGLTRSAAQKLLEEGAVTAQGRPLKKSEKTAAGVPISVAIPEPAAVSVALLPRGDRRRALCFTDSEEFPRDLESGETGKRGA